MLVSLEGRKETRRVDILHAGTAPNSIRVALSLLLPWDSDIIVARISLATAATWFTTLKVPTAICYMWAKPKEGSKRELWRISVISPNQFSLSQLANISTNICHSDLDAVEFFVLKFISATPDRAQAKHLHDESELSWMHCLCTALAHGLNSMH